MAEQYLEFSEVLTQLTDEQIDWLKEQLEIVHVSEGTGGETWSGCRAYRDLDNYDSHFGGDVGFDYSFSEEVHEEWGHHLRVYSTEHGYVDRVAHLVQKFLRKFRPDACWSLTYACTCSKPRVGEFGGGAVVVTATKIEHFNTWQFVEQKGDN